MSESAPSIYDAMRNIKFAVRYDATYRPESSFIPEDEELEAPMIAPDIFDSQVGMVLGSKSAVQIADMMFNDVVFNFVDIKTDLPLFLNIAEQYLVRHDGIYKDTHNVNSDALFYRRLKSAFEKLTEYWDDYVKRAEARGERIYVRNNRRNSTLADFISMFNGGTHE